MTNILPEKQWLTMQPKKLVGAKVVIKSADGNVLLVKPTYKPTWQLPGGVVEASESPRSAAVREICEEIGLVCEDTKMKLTDIVFRSDQDVLLVMYELVDAQDETAQLQLQNSELEAYEWVAPDKVAQRLPGYYADFWQRYTTA
jgi:8-oxo-dGTP diphosphatase